MKVGQLAIIALGILSSVPAAAQRKQRTRPAAAQDTVIKGATIEIIQSYKPEVTRAPRPEPMATLPPVDTNVPAMQYTVPQQTLFFSYGSLPIRPLALDIHHADNQFANYVKVGGGNLSTLYLDAGIASLKGENYETAISVNHLSQKGSIANQKVSLTGADATGTLHTNGHAIGAKLGVHHDRYHYFGYDHSQYTYGAPAVRQAFTTIDAGTDLQSDSAEYKKLKYHPSINYYSFSESKTGNAENAVNISVPVTYSIDSNFEVFAAVNANIAGYAGQGNNIFQLAPGLRFSKDIFAGHISLAPTIGKGKTYFLPDAEVRFTLPQTQFMFNAGIQGKLVQNTFRQLASQNPYMFTTYNQLQTQTTEVFAGIKSNIGSHITFSGRASWWQYNNLPLFINDTAGDMKNFTLLHDSKVNAFSLQAGIRYQVAHIFAIGFSGQWLNFIKKSNAEVWHTPGVRFTGDVAVQPIKKLTITGYVSFIDQIYALESGNRSIKLNPGLDIGAGAEYEIIKRLNLFLQANNLLNSKYQLWYGYEAFGLNVFGGVRLKF